MISAFGVEHEFSKSYTKLAPKLKQATANMGLISRSENMDFRVRRNYAAFRNKSGKASLKIQEDQRLGRGSPALKPYRIKLARELKDEANASVTAAGNRNKKSRYLP